MMDASMREQIFILERQRRELLTINEKWAREYNTMVAFYQNKLLSLQASQRNHSDVQQEKRQPKTQTVNSELHTAVTEAKDLRAQNSVLTRRGQHQQEEINRLNKALEERLHPVQTLEESSGPPDDLWKHQAEVFKEDFLKERGDREMLHHKYGELQKKLSKVQDELHFIKSQASWTRILQPVVDCNCKWAEQRNARVHKK
ncbi:TNFAIP3-interacting protein 3-like [Hippocampus zosterae]|uniref:TNFAIP3-interacting protein 3-like n=1 Tax=Hippocampus zosterae TaxID=109293 RepID=UPI00223DE5E9|nr:TNFAIP3-interacting protein 3-like [Hippocampus zosterae]